MKNADQKLPVVILGGELTGLSYAILRLTNDYVPRDFDRVIPLLIEKSLENKNLIVFGENKMNQLKIKF